MGQAKSNTREGPGGWREGGLERKSTGGNGVHGDDGLSLAEWLGEPISCRAACPGNLHLPSPIVTKFMTEALTWTEAAGAGERSGHTVCPLRVAGEKSVLTTEPGDSPALNFLSPP